MAKKKKAASVPKKKITEFAETPHRGKSFAGKHATKGTAYEPAATLSQSAALEMAAGGPLNERPRPSKSRYPIDMDTFDSLKESATGAIGSVKNWASAMTVDATKKTPELAMEAPAAAAAPGTPMPSAPTAMTNFKAIPATGWLPPDCTMAAGPSNILVAVNGNVSVFARTGGAAQVTRRLDAWFSNVVTNAKVFDPKALYDQHAGRWVLLAVAMPNDTSVHESYFLLSVSKTADPLKGWFNYKIDAAKDGSTATTNWADYPSLGLDNQAFYLTANMFKFGGNYQYAKLRIIAKAQAYAGSALTFTDFTKLKNADGSLCFTVQPCHTFGAPGVQSFINTLFPGGTTPTQKRVTLWSLTNPLTSPSLTSRSVPVDPYGLAPNADQQGTAPALESGDVRVLNAVFRGGSVWAGFSTAHDWGDGVGVASCRWMQVNATSGTIIQQGVFGAKKFHYFYPAVMPDTNGNMTMVFCRSGSSEFASIRYSGRLSSDPAGTLQGSALLKSGEATYNGPDGSGRNRWGDYAGAASDPVDGRLVWFYSMYAALPANTWGTWIGSARF